MSAPIVGEFLNKVADPNAITTNTSNQINTKLAPAVTEPVTTPLVQQTPELQRNANEGLTQAAKNTATATAPVAESINQSGTNQQEQGQGLQDQSQNNYTATTELINNKLIDAENSLKDANSKATIDPQGFLNNMGVSKGTAVALGMLLSSATAGAGAALTGQPNLAVQALQTSIQRDIEAQKATFANKVAIQAKQQGLLQTAADLQKINIAASQAGNILVNNGVANHAQGLQLQLSGQNAPALNNLNMLNLNGQVLKNIGDFGQSYIGAVNSGDSKYSNILGLMADAFKEQTLGGKPIGGVTNQVEPKFEKTPPTTNPAMSTEKIKAVPGENGVPLTNQVPGETFLDAMARAGKAAVSRKFNER